MDRFVLEQLAAKTGCTVSKNDAGDTVCTMTNLELCNLAVSIVYECMLVANGLEYPDYDEDDDDFESIETHNKALKDVVYSLQEHFGVK